MHSRAFKRLPRALRVNSRELGQRLFLSDPRQPEVDFLHSWAVVLPKRSGESSADLLPPGILKGKKALISGCLGLLKNAFSQAP